MEKILVFMLLFSVALITNAQEKERRSYADNQDVETRKEGAETNHNYENAKKNENENWNENEKKKCDGYSSPAENTPERFTNAGEYEIIGYLYPAYPPAQPYYNYYEIAPVYEK